MDISNKTLAMFLVAAIVVSIAGTIISLNKITEVGPGGLTGMAPTDTGNVTVNVGATVSIIISGDDTIAFQCSPSPDYNYTVNSEVTDDTGVACTVPAAPDPIVVLNDGNVNANVSINVSDIGEQQGGTMVLSPGGWSGFAYRTMNTTSSGGCYGSYQAAYANFTSTVAFYIACDNLTYGANNGMRFHAQLFLPEDTFVGSSYSEILFWAKEAV